jgi:hypothetical protein
VDTDLDTLATALFVKTDDLLKSSPQLAPWRPTVGITPKQPGYNKRLRKAAELVRHVTRELATDTALWTGNAWVVDSTPVECGRSKETVKRSDLAGWAQYGYCASHSRYFWGLRLHLVCTLGGLPIAFALTGAKADERETLLRHLRHRAPPEPPTHPPYDCCLPAGLTERDDIGIGNSGRAPGARAEGLDHWSSEPEATSAVRDGAVPGRVPPHRAPGGPFLTSPDCWVRAREQPWSSHRDKSDT